MKALVSVVVLLLSPALLGAQEFWVSPGGSDHNPGTREAPLASIAQAQARLREVHPAAGTLRKIILRDGTHFLTSPLLFRADDSRLRLEAARGERPVLSGGVVIHGWKKQARKVPGLPDSARGQVWVADAPKAAGEVLEFRQLWINNRKAVRARTPNGDDMFRLLAWDKTNRAAWIPAAALGRIEKPNGLEMVIDQVWEIAVLRVKTTTVLAGRARLTFQEPESKAEFEHPWPPIIVNSNYAAPFFLANAAEFLDSPGEWFEDLRAGKIYYWPRDGEEMSSAEAVAPVLETLVEIRGTLDAPVTNIQFHGLTFANASWLRPSQAGHVPLQAGMFLLDAHKLVPRGTSYAPKLDNVAWIGRPPAAVLVQNANSVSFNRCFFEHTASAALDFEFGTHDDMVQGCVFRDVGGNGIQLGTFSDTNVETHIAWNPTDQREICTCEQISNNLIQECGTEDWGCVGIGVGYAREISIAHNEISSLPYTGISVGWGWTKATNAMRGNLVFANHIHHVGQKLGDLGGVYTLSAQPGTVVAENSIHDLAPSRYVPDPEHWFYLYLDEGSSFITVRDNWCPAEKFLRNANGPGNVWTNNGPRVSEKIKAAAGLEPAYQDLLRSL